jgi:hypothetical protein
MNSKPRLDLKELERQQSVQHRLCNRCGAAVPRSSEINICLYCQDTVVFHEVKEYIRQNNVNEVQVAEHFGLPLALVKRWMNDRRIEYIKPAIRRDLF